METNSHKNHFAYQVGKPTLAMLNAYREFGVISRAFMINEHGKILKDIRSHAEPFKDYSEKDLIFAEGRIYVELVERLCQLIEDLSSLCYALWKPLPDFPMNILDRSKPSPREILVELSKPARWFTILRYPNLDIIEMSDEDKEFLRQHYERNIRILRNLAEVLEKFRKIHWKFYTKHKHANPLTYGIKTIEVEGEQTMIIPAYYDAEHPESVKGIVINYSMYKMQRKLVNTVIQLMGDLVGRAISFIERDGKPLIEYASYYKMNDIANQRLQALIGEYNKNVKYTTIQVTLKVDVPRNVIQRFKDFYSNLDLGAFDT